MKQRLIESFYKDWETTDYQPEKISLTEKNNTVSLKESKYPVLSAYKIPVWKLDQKNYNGRVYPKSLGEKVLKENKVTVALDTHPADDYDPKIKDIVAIGKNPSIENTNIGPVLFAECYFVDKELAEKVDRAIDHGYKFEQSSSGFGELNEKDEVIAETYELERYFDLLVSDSSYAVSFSKENEIKQEEATIQENKISSTNLIEEEKIDNNKEKLMSDDKKLSFEDKMIRRSIKQSFKEASEIADPKERLVELKEINSYFEDVNDKEAFTDLYTEVGTCISEATEEISSLAEKGKQFDAVVEEKEKVMLSVEELNEKMSAIEKVLEEKTSALKEAEEKLDIAFEEMDKSKETYQNLKVLFEDKTAEANTLVDPEDYVALFEENKSLENKSKTLEKRIDLFIKKLEESKKENRKPLRKKEAPVVEAPEVEKEATLEEAVAEKPKFEIKKKHGDLRIETQSKEITEYYEDLRNIYGESIESFREDFENCTTLQEAQHCFFRHKPFLSESMSLRANDRRHVVDRFKEETIASKNESLGNRSSIELENCKPDPNWI